MFMNHPLFWGCETSLPFMLILYKTLSSEVSDTASNTVCQNIAYNIKTYLVTLSSDVSTLSASDTASTTVCKNIAYN